jgi:hypothetical protein
MKQFEDLSKDDKFFSEALQGMIKNLHSLKIHAKAYTTSDIAKEVDKLFCATSFFFTEICSPIPYTPVAIVLPTDELKVVELLQDEITELKQDFENLLDGYRYIAISDKDRHVANIRNLTDYLQHILAERKFNLESKTEAIKEFEKEITEIKYTKKAPKNPPSSAK